MLAAEPAARGEPHGEISGGRAAIVDVEVHAGRGHHRAAVELVGRGAHDAGAAGSRSSSCRRRRPPAAVHVVRHQETFRRTHHLHLRRQRVRARCAPLLVLRRVRTSDQKVDSAELCAATATAVPSDHQERSKRKELNQRVATAIKPHPFLGGVNWRCSGGSAIIHTHGPMASRTPISSCTLFLFVTSRRTATARRHLTPGAPPPQPA